MIVKKIFSLLIFGVLLSSGKSALAEVDVPIFRVSCTAGIQLCEPAFSTSITTTEPRQLIQFRYDVHPNHCSSVRVHIYLDGALVRTTEYLGWPDGPTALPLTTNDIQLGAVRPGVHVVSVSAEGQVGGCNTGQLNAWGGKLRIFAQ